MTINGSPAGSIPGGFPTRATYGPGLPPFNAAPARGQTVGAVPKPRGRDGRGTNAGGDMRYTITVSTGAHKHDGKNARRIWFDEMHWRRVDAETVDWFAGSCKAAVGWYATRPAVVEGEHYTVTYSTVILGEDGREHPGTVRLGLQIQPYPLYAEPKYAVLSHKGILVDGEPKYTHGFSCVYEDDPVGATRRAIVLAAAEIGRAMP